jgi:hypothetical protein
MPNIKQEGSKIQHFSRITFEQCMVLHLGIVEKFTPQFYK